MDKNFLVFEIPIFKVYSEEDIRICFKMIKQICNCRLPMVSGLDVLNSTQRNPSNPLTELRILRCVCVD
jgi:hypothetical protein